MGVDKSKMQDWQRKGGHWGGQWAGQSMSTLPLLSDSYLVFALSQTVHIEIIVAWADKIIE